MKKSPRRSLPARPAVRPAAAASHYAFSPALMGLCGIVIGLCFVVLGYAFVSDSATPRMTRAATNNVIANTR